MGGGAGGSPGPGGSTGGFSIFLLKIFCVCVVTKRAQNPLYSPQRTNVSKKMDLNGVGRIEMVASIVQTNRQMQSTCSGWTGLNGICSLEPTEYQCGGTKKRTQDPTDIRDPPGGTVSRLLGNAWRTTEHLFRGPHSLHAHALTLTSTLSLSFKTALRTISHNEPHPTVSFSHLAPPRGTAPCCCLLWRSLPSRVFFRTHLRAPQLVPGIPSIRQGILGETGCIRCRVALESRHTKGILRRLF